MTSSLASASPAMVLVSRSGQKQAAASIIEKLPSDVMVSIMGFVALHVRVRFASCSARLQKLLYQDCVPLWIDINFGDVRDQMKLRLTDEMLASLLTRVNARNITQTLNLVHCQNIRGTGLEPLSDSRVLEKVYLQQEGGDGMLDESIAVRILRSMVPYKLFHVRFREELLECPNVETNFHRGLRIVTNFLRDLRAAKLQHARDHKLTCRSCHNVVVEESKKLVTNLTGVPSPSCGVCQHHFCRRGSCSVGLTDCLYCGDSSCADCAQMKRCTSCAHSYCTTCNPVTSCDGCSKGYCRDCLYDCSCGDCAKKLCEECNNMQDNFIRRCDGCDEEFCRNCRKVGSCAICEEEVCENCAKLKRCGTCSESFCVFCLEVNYLECCSETHCIACVTPKQCDGCSKNFRRVEQCGTCNKSLCTSCQETEHRQSDNSFCMYNEKPPKKKARKCRSLV